jgi:tetratricopeptide (TPR) repeat protein
LVRRVIAPLLVVAAAALVLARWTVAPALCNRTQMRVVQRNIIAHGQKDADRSTQNLWDNVRDAQRCLDRVPHDIVLLTAQADSFALLGRHEDAIAKLSEALRYDPRPELYIYLGMSQLAAGHREAGLDSLTRAGSFYGNVGYAGYMLRGIPERDLVLQRLEAASR